MATLYEIAQALETVIDGGLVFDETTGEVIWDATDLQELRLAFGEKLEACALFVKNLEADAAAIKVEETKLAERRRLAERKAERLKAYMVDVLQDKTDTQRFSTPRVALSLRKSEAVIISDESALSPDYVVTKTTTQPDKTAIKKAIKAGAVIEGAALVERQNLAIK